MAKNNGVKTAVITGCDFGLGVELAREALRLGYRVFAGCYRSRSAKEMRKLQKSSCGALTPFNIDMSSEASIQRAAGFISRKTKAVDVLVNNAALCGYDNVDKVTMRAFHRMFAVNSFGPMVLLRRLRRLLAASGAGKVVNISSEAGSIGTANNIRGIYAYSASKTALNMLMHRAALELAPEKTSVVMLHPGWMNTPMGRTAGKPPQNPADTARDVFKIAARMGAKESGGFFLHNGKRYPW
jgi:NAD(P)-dependent dehydrogenase (short-subunit alcohol dehydrogenase family)